MRTIFPEEKDACSGLPAAPQDMDNTLVAPEDVVRSKDTAKDRDASMAVKTDNAQSNKDEEKHSEVGCVCINGTAHPS